MGGLEKKAFSFGATPEGYCSHKCFFFLWSTYGTHRTVWQEKSSSPTPLTSFPQDLGSHTPRVKDKPGEPYRTGKMFCVACERQSLKPFQHHSQCAALQTKYATPPHRFAARISTREHMTSVTTFISCSG